MKEIEHVLKRVRVLDKEGEFKRLSERQFAVARAIAERTVDGDRGCQLAIQQVALGAFKQRSTVKTALGELVKLGVLHRSKPGPGPYETHIFRFAQAILEAANKPNPHDARPGREVFINAAAVDGDGTLTTSEPKTTMESVMKTSKPDGQLLAGQELAGNCNGITHPPFPDPSPEEIKTDPASCSPALQGGMCNDIHQDRDLKDDLTSFFDFLKFFNFSSFETFCMRRDKDDSRGGVFRKKEINSCEDLEKALLWAEEQKAELVMRCPGLLLVDDVSGSMVEKAKQSGLSFFAVETSENNHQLLFVGDPTWTKDQTKTAQLWLRMRYLGDFGSTDGGHLHRMPGSINCKKGGRFIARLRHLQRGELVRLPATRADVSAVVPAVSAASNPGKSTESKDTSDSSIDFVEAFRLIRAGKTREQVEDAMRVSACAPGRNGKHGNGIDYAKRTAQSAFSKFRRRPTTVSFGPKSEVTEVTLKT